MNLFDLFVEINRRSRALSLAGWACLALCLLAIGPAWFDVRTVTGLNPWFKPMKFMLSFAIYAWTMAWLLDYLPISKRTAGQIGSITAAGILLEVVIMTGQAARGTTSHYNEATWLDQTLFSLMGAGIVVLTLVMVLMLFWFCTKPVQLPRPYLWGIRGGYLLFLLGLIPGWFMIYNAAHTVGAPDGGPGLPWVDWSLQAGDLRVAHFLGLHALQVLPLCGYLLSLLQQSSFRLQQVCLATLTTGYGVAMCLTGVQAMLGMPLVSL